MAELKSRIAEATTTAMKARDKARVGALRLVNAEIQRVEVDERRAVTDADVLTVLTRMIKQRKDSESQYRAANRADLADQEAYEIALIHEFMPEALGDDELDALIERTIADTGAASMRDMGKVMATLKSEVAGRADMGQVSERVKQRLS